VLANVWPMWYSSQKVYVGL